MEGIPKRIFIIVDLPGAILADQCHNVTRLYPEAHILENFVAKELFFNVIHFQYVLTAQNFSPSSKLGRLAAFKPILWKRGWDAI